MDTWERILDSAQRLTQTRSFDGFSFQDIASEVGVRKASLYHHFESKDDVAVAMLDVAVAMLQRAADWVSAQFKKVGSTRCLLLADAVEKGLVILSE
jgi:AcrR family transcriptional regulator